MPKKYDKVCWACGKAKMEDKGDYYQCTACNATWNSLPQQQPAALCQGSEPIYDKSGGIVGRKSKPSVANIKALQRAAAHKSGQGNSR